ncbi:MAG: hypothetical protein ABI670_04910 [Chloroflexota bacterium]
MLEQALQGARLLYAYTMFIDAPVDEVFRFTGNPDYWTRTFEGEPNPQLSLTWEGKPYKPGSIMVLSAVRKDGTPTTVGSVRMELIYYAENEEITYRYLNGNHIIYRFVYEVASPTRTEFTVNALVDVQSSRLNTLRQRLYANRRRKAAVGDHLRVKSVLEQRSRRGGKG